MTVVTETILSSWLREAFGIVHVDTSDHRAISNVGRLDVRNIALGLKAVFLVTTLVGITGLWPAILADTGATVLVTANAMRLLAWRPKRA